MVVKEVLEGGGEYKIHDKWESSETDKLCWQYLWWTFVRYSFITIKEEMYLNHLQLHIILD